MNTTVFELNDTGIYCNGQQGSALISPGYALLTNTGVATGTEAQQRFWLEPQHSYNQFWRQLSLSPLPTVSRYARHHADLAYAQLLQLHRDCGEPEDVIFAVPGSFSNEQLGILLGLAKASPFNVVGLVDAAIAATSQASLAGQLLHLDIQLHQTVITGVTVDNNLRRSHIEVIPELGLKHFHDKWAQHIANLFIRQYRYDPLHTAAGEQQLNNHLPAWLTALNGLDSTTINMDTPQGNYRLNLVRSELLESSSPLFNRLSNAVTKLKTSDAQLLLSHRCAQLPGFSQHWSNAVPLTQQATVEGCLNHLDVICSTGESLNFVTSLPRQNVMQQMPDNVRRVNNHSPTHLLYRHKAYRLGDKLPDELDQLDLQFVKTDEGYTLTPHTGKIGFDGDPKNLQTGDRFTLESGETVSLIEVC
ncbi:MAG: hypothetical protein R3E73_14635 [Porticoccaceae bacterium]|nr:hypothetical protein [Pseudomonadales bacterium]MCP5173402.1 hypothetical protein [Pseudomonadales bacterium]MCP5303214.1 hypothetical protein [Pseudomonadales bacterium]